MKTYLIAGASGNVASRVASSLAEQGNRVHAITSKAERAGKVEGNLHWVCADPSQGKDVADIFAGVDRAFLYVPPGYAAQDTFLAPLLQAAVDHKLEKVVLLTAFGANADENSPLRLAERQLEQSGIAYNIVRPNWFMQNFSSFWLQGINEQNAILLPTAQAKGSFIDVRDIADVVVRLIATDDLNNQAFDITGSQALDHDEVAAILSRVTGRHIVYQQIAPQQLKEGLLQAGLPEDYADFLLLILSYFAQGHSEAVTGSVKALLGREPITFEQYANDYRAAWV